MRSAFLLLLAIPALAQEIKVQMDGRIVSMPIERYVEAVLVGESSVFHSPEALKAMAVAARTYAVRMRGRHAAEGFDFCSTTHCQRADAATPAAALQTAAASTASELLWFQGKPAFTPYSRDCGGRTEEAAAVWPDLAAPYLTSRPDPACERDAGSPWQWRVPLADAARALRTAGLRIPARLDRIAVRKATGSGRASVLSLEGAGEAVPLDARSFRFAIGRTLGWNLLPGDLYRVWMAGAQPVVEGRGSGHGVGLCQHGAEQMGLAGRDYREILAAYYPGTKLGISARGISWQRLAGDSVVLLTTDPSHDGPLVATAERLWRAARSRTRASLSEPVEIRVYPDLDSFRDATGEPGWVAGRSSGHRIDLQPASVLERRASLEATLRHELLHVAVESQARAVPLWFREGLVDCLAQPVETAGPVRIPPDAELRLRGDESRARAANRDAARAVQALVARYGETAVLGWLRGGLPPELKNAAAIQPATKSR